MSEYLSRGNGWAMAGFAIAIFSITTINPYPMAAAFLCMAMAFVQANRIEEK